MIIAEEPRKNFEQVEGRNAVLEAMRGPRTVSRIYLAEGIEGGKTVAQILSIAAAENIPVMKVARGEISKMAQTSAPQGIIATVSQFPYATPRDLIESLHDGRTPLVLALDGVEDPQNFGTLLRVSEACGVHGVIIGQRRASPVTPTVCKASAGACEYVNVVRVANVSGLLLRLKKEGLWVLGAEAEGGIPYYEADLSAPSVIVLGGEGGGLGHLVKERCDILVRLPMLGKVSSLNVSNAGAVILYEAIRQRSVGAPS
jgi:23S rRNA (guanosine2251-2'-O)-methyltransferase